MEKQKKQKKDGLFKKLSANDKKESTILLQRNNLILDLKKAYMDLDEEEIKQKIMQTIDDTSSILDVLKLGSSEYGFMAKAIIKKNDEITERYQVI